MFTYAQALLFGLLQGITELFPISSLGHSVVLPRLMGWHLNQSAPFFLTFLVATHSATALVLFIFFWKDWKRIIAGLFRSFANRKIDEHDTDAKLGWLLVVGTVPAGILGLILEQPLQSLFASPQLVAILLVGNGILLWCAEQLQKKNLARPQTDAGSDTRIARLTWLQSIKIGAIQALALIPGFSRTGAAMTGSLLVGLSHEDAARFAFLLATPVIAAASLLKLPELALTNESQYIGQTIVGAVTAGIAAYVSVKFLTHYFETNRLTPFAYYCMGVGVVLSILFLFR